MAQGYIINYSDGVLNFTLAPYAVDGPEGPFSESLFRNATNARTSLIIAGKGFPDYGERIGENMLHLLEHFASETEPSYPVGGQIWYDRSQNPPVPRIYNLKRHTNISADPNFVTIDGDHTTRFNSLSRVRIFDPSDSHYEEYLINSVTLTSGDTVIAIADPIGTRSGWYVGDWDALTFASNGLIDGYGARVTNIDTSLTEPTDAVNVQSMVTYVSGTVGTIPAVLDDLTDVTITGPLVDEHILSYNTGSGQWENQLLGDEITAIGDITLSGELNMGGNRIVNMLDPDDGNPGVNSMAVTVGYLNVKLAAGGTGVSELPDLTDVYSSLNPNTDDFLKWDGFEWNSISLVDLTTLILTGVNLEDYVPLSGTTYGSPGPAYMDVDAFIHYDPTSAYRSDLGNDTALRTHLQDTTLISLDMGDTLYGGTAADDRVEYGAFVPSLGTGVVQLSWQAGNPPTDPYLPGILPGGSEDGVQFNFDVTDGRHTTIDPKTQSDGDKLLFERSVAEVTTTYPLLPLRDIFDELNQILGFRSALPYRTQIDASSFPRPSTETLNENYIPGKANLEIYINGTKQTPSIHNWQRASILATSNSGITNFGVGNFNITFDWVGILGDVGERFLELQDLGQNITLKTNTFAIVDVDTGSDILMIAEDHSLTFNTVSTVTVTGSTGNDGLYNISGVSYNGGTNQTEITVTTNLTSGVADGTLQSVKGTYTINDVEVFPDTTRVYISPSFVIAGDPNDWLVEADNDANTNQRVWGGYPTGLLATERYGFVININTGSPTFSLEPIIHGFEGNMATLVSRINDWSADNGEHFSAYLEGGFLYFISAHPGTNSDVSVSASVPADLTFSIIDCLTENGDKVPGVGIDEAFIVSGDQTEHFVSGLGLSVTGSVSNDGSYTITLVEYNTISAGNTAVYVGSDGEIPDLNDTTGTINLSSISLFANIVGGPAEHNRFYFYEFDMASVGSWTEKTDIDTNMTMSGDYDEVGMVGFESNTIEWTSAPSSGLVEYIIRPEPEINH